MGRTIAVGAAVACVAGLGFLWAADAGTKPVERFKADAVHSSVVFKIKHLNIAYFYGRFNELAGSFRLDPNDASSSSFRFQLRTESIDTHNKLRDKHLLSPGFFDAKKRPTISFNSTQV